MKYLTDRTEIAKAINFGKYPVLYIDLDNRPYDTPGHNSDFAIGCKCRVDWEHKDRKYKGMTSRCEVFYSEGQYSLNQGGTFLKNDFGRQDVLEMAEWANTPLVRCGQEVVLIEDYTKQKMCKVRIMKLDDSKDINCSTVTRLVDIE